MIANDFRPIKNFPGYFIGETGEVLSFKRKQPRFLTPVKRRGGYLVVCVQSPEGQKTVEVHILVAAAFIGERPAGHHVCHHDGNPENNNVENLRYDTPKNNSQDIVRHGRTCVGEKNGGGGKLTESDVRSILDDPRPGRVIAAEYGIGQTMVSRIKRRETWKHLH